MKESDECGNFSTDVKVGSVVKATMTVTEGGPGIEGDPTVTTFKSEAMDEENVKRYIHANPGDYGVVVGNEDTTYTGLTCRFLTKGTATLVCANEVELQEEESDLVKRTFPDTVIGNTVGHLGRDLDKKVSAFLNEYLTNHKKVFAFLDDYLTNQE